MRVPPSGRSAGRHEHVRDAFRHSGFVGSWFAEVDRAVASAAERQGFDEVVKLLGGLQLARLALSDQVVVVEDGETWIKLNHDSEPLLRIEIGLNDGWVHFYGVMGGRVRRSVRMRAASARSDVV